MTGPRAILFDWDNTLVDSWGTIQQAMNDTLTAMGHAEWDLAETKRRVALSLKDSFPTLFGDRWQQARTIFYDTITAIHLDRLQVLPGAADCILKLHRAGMPMGVVSNKKGDLIRKEVASLGWQAYFHRVVGAGDAGADKPSPLPVSLVLDAIGMTADDSIWFVGDQPVDMECAANSGLRPILLRHEPWVEQDFARHPPALRFWSWQDFGQHLNDILP